MSNELYRVTPRVAREYVVDCIESGLVPFVQGSPGVGKSSIMRSISDQFHLKLIDHRLSTSAPEDLSGLPRFDEKGRAHFAAFADLFPLQDTPVPEGFDGWMLFLDEFNSAREDVQAASYKLVLDKMTGQEKLHENVVITAAGNLASDKAIVNDLATAMQSRVVHIEMVHSFQEWLEDVALPQNYDPRIIAYLSQFNSSLMAFDPDHDEKTFPCPRTWEFLNRLIYGKTFAEIEKIEHGVKRTVYEMERKTSLYAGTIGASEATKFVQFTKVFGNLPSLEQIMRDPDNAVIPHDHSTKWAAVTSMAVKVDARNFGPLATYFNRYDLSFKILFFRMVMIQNASKLRSHPAFINAMGELDEYLNGN